MSSDYTLLKSVSLYHSSTLPIGFEEPTQSGPQIFKIFAKTSINPISQREYLTSAKFTFSNSPEPLKNPSKNIPTYDLFNNPSETPAFTYLENSTYSITTLNTDIFILQIQVISSDCLAPIFLLDNTDKVDMVENDEGISMHIAEEKSDNHNRFLDFLKVYHQFNNGSKIKLTNGFTNGSKLYLKVFCFYWTKPVAPKIILELFFDKKSHIDISLGKL
jgi:hypothetical protein